MSPDRLGKGHLTFEGKVACPVTLSLSGAADRCGSTHERRGGAVMRRAGEAYAYGYACVPWRGVLFRP